ncbi:tRNA 4-thiouridine(8) synthase ThiI, partial [Candidatus Micrarchaeota archaeon]|nr:tRNA 4-thiouridine(8) synthase ThiI [Candidatus Micrarchaeota archaeon]
KAVELLNEFDFTGKTMKVETKRGDKKLPFTSMELSRDVGEALINAYGCTVDLHHPSIIINIDILQKGKAYIFFEKSRGAGGLPSGCSGKCVSLLSGGIDSPVASWMLMKRGTKLTFLHVHALPIEEIKESKIIKIAEELAQWQNGAKLYLADYSEFYKKTLSMPNKYELVLFKLFINFLAQKVAEKEGALGIVNGDSLGQVASQTLENINAASIGIKLPFFRPLIGMDKREIIAIAEKIGTYPLSIEKYKDCCSLVSVQSPETKADSDFVQRLAEKIGLNEIVEKTLEKAEILEIK